MTILYNKLNESFDAHSGQLVSYTSDGTTPFASAKHYNIRSFWGTDISVPQTMLDLSYWNVYSYTGQTMDQLSQRRSITGSVFRRHTQDDFSIATGGSGAATYETQHQMDGTQQFNLDFASVSAGNEDWPAGDSTVVVGKDSAYRYSNTIRISLTAGTTKTIPSFYVDDILTDFNDGNTYYIELVLRAFPAQAAGAHLDLANSFIDFSSSEIFDSSVTDSIRFNQSLNSLTAGGDLAFRIPVSYLVKSNISNLRAIQFRLLATGGAMTFIAQQMRLIPAGWTPLPVAIDTKRGVLARAVPEAGGTESSNILGNIFYQETRPEDSTIYAAFNSGHLDTTNDNILRIFVRYIDANNWTRVSLFSRASQTQIIVRQNTAGIQTVLFTLTQSALLPETDYYLKIVTAGSNLNVSLSLANGNFIGTAIINTGSITVQEVARGYIGYSFEPYNYDFTLDFLSVTEADFVRYASSIFSSRTPVVAATLQSQSSPPINIIEDVTLVASGDATSNIAAIGKPSPSTQIVRDGNQWFGGIIQQDATPLGNPAQVSVEGDIYPVGQVRGQYRVLLLDKNNSVGWVGYITGMLPNQWNHFSIPVSYDLLPVSYKLSVQQIGFYNDTFYLDNLAVNHLSIAWEASADAGAHWQPFGSAINGSYTGIKFLNPGTDLRVRATAVSDRAWLQGFELIPQYGWGRFGLNITYPGSTANIAQDVRITASSASQVSTSYDVRINGPLTINTSQNVRLTASSLPTPTTLDARVNGINGSSKSQDVRVTGAGGQPVGVLMGITS